MEFSVNFRIAAMLRGISSAIFNDVIWLQIIKDHDS